MSEYWMEEKHTDGYRVSWKITNILHEEKTPFQELAVVETTEWGKALILDNAVQITEKDEFIYHEMIVHPVMYIHPNPEKVLIIGGGDGGTLREVLKHKRVKKADMVEIDGKVVEASKRFFPEVSCSFDDPRANLFIEDGIKYVKETKEKYDIIIVDSSDPVGPAVELFGIDFYRDAYRILNEDGIIVVQSESPIFFKETFLKVQSYLKQVFPMVYVYWAVCPTYVSGPWTFTMASKKYVPDKFPGDKELVDGLKYYNEGIHTAAFNLPRFIREML
ncbi:polyamine aminopropyltransferase [Thermosyntropha sp.]|uniref:polyamine aminopropyltransferase n=1 Tax=Thermosyntropha sp. TaxID=2740820 RepID=UPI0025EFE462|nr:polyamine aminopropyltransferase [Thermosyntropha sp.]MBO8158471.1 polyamine aminopropyltransferase [Thermosyntropha sp.]